MFHYHVSLLVHWVNSHLLLSQVESSYVNSNMRMYGWLVYSLLCHLIMVFLRVHWVNSNMHLSQLWSSYVYPNRCTVLIYCWMCTGFEPNTLGLLSQHSNNWATRPTVSSKSCLFIWAIIGTIITWQPGLLCWCFW